MYYGKIMDTLAQHHPEYVALVWGAMKFVLTDVINRANLFEKLSQALNTIRALLPQMNPSAELYQTQHMEAALSRLFVYVIFFSCRCICWYAKSSLSRMCSAIITPFDIDYKDLVEHIQECSKVVDDFANTGTQAEIRDVRILTELELAQVRELDVKMLKMLEPQTKFKAHVMQLLQVAITHKSIMERIDVNVYGISQTVYRIEFSGVMRFFEPKVLPKTALLNVRPLVPRDLAPSLPSPTDRRMRKTILDWAFGRGPSFLIVQAGLRAQKQAKELVTNMIENLKPNNQCVL
ncbi:hypothetical protein G6011_08606 [Alternaria panax]|uniref:DUF7708 domain-containing protein n=1 Tax=Alternaria panax TaxID=48097 RepID=A0AAD4FKA3_9PLEO|nr:hypothetical protein G6011_08606 [Alternaria panax]